MNHIGGRINCALAADENDAAPICPPHCRQAKAGKAHSAQHVDIEKSLPIGIGNLFERLGLEDSKIVNENLDVRMVLHQLLGCGSGAEIAGESLNGTGRRRLDLGHVINRRL